MGVLWVAKGPMFLTLIRLCRCTVQFEFLLYAHTNFYYIPITDTTLELSVFWPSDTESRINELRFSESISQSEANIGYLLLR